MVLRHMSWRKVLATAAATAMIATSTVSGASAASFSDVPASHQSAVNYLVEKGIVKGTTEGTFGADSLIKRADAAIMVVRALGFENIVAPDSGFKDVPAYAENAVNVLRDLGVVNGKSANAFGANDPLTRSEMAKIIALAYELPTEGQSHPFTDVSADFSSYVQAVYGAGITEGAGNGTFGSHKHTTRGEFAVFLVKADQYEVENNHALVSELTGMINEDHTVTITGKATDVEKVIVILENGNNDIKVSATVENGQFSITTNIPEQGITEVTVEDENGKLLYEGVAGSEVTTATSLGKFKIHAK